MNSVESAPLRAPAVPLIVHDPYFSIWSFQDELTKEWPRHWTGIAYGISGLLRIDGKCRNFCGSNSFAPAMKQRSVEILPTRTIYRFEAEGVELELTFLTPALPHRLDVLSRPLTYVIFRLASTDGKPHKAELCFDCGAELCVNLPTEKIVWGRAHSSRFELLYAASTNQRPLTIAGDDLRINWGKSCLIVPAPAEETAIAPSWPLRTTFAKTGELPEADDLDFPIEAKTKYQTLAAKLTFDVPAEGTVERFVAVAYEDPSPIEYLGQKLRPYWRESFSSFREMVEAALEEFTALREECERYDRMLLEDARKCGGEKYARLCALAFRQAIGAHKLTADFDGSALFFSKENFSNGCIATVDVTYPSAPLFLLTAPELVKGMLRPILRYAESRRWKFPFAPHDLGTYPLANGQVYGGGEEREEDQMPVEESGNMLLLAGALVVFTGDTAFAAAHEATLRKWAEYLLDKGYDPENQLCTDDFAGHLAHNTNLSLKAILALGAYSRIAAALGHADEAEKFRSTAEAAARKWVVDAADQDHYRLAFDQPGSWSQKYNLVWDRLLDLNLFPEEVAEKELAFYRAHQNRYGLPLDSRRTYTKLDWILWSATLTGRAEDFAALLDPVYLWLNETPTRVPLTDWYETTDGKKVGFQARSVVGGVFLRMMSDPELRKKYLAL